MLSQEQLEALCGPFVEKLRQHDGELGFLLVAFSSDPGTPDGGQPFLMRTNANGIAPMCLLLSMVLEAIAEIESRPPEIIRPEELN